MVCRHHLQNNFFIGGGGVLPSEEQRDREWAATEGMQPQM